jgi:hypothetical protein
VQNGWRQRTIERIEAIEGWTFDSQRRLTWWGRWELTFGCEV